MTIREFRLPDPGEGLVEAEIVNWHVGVGDQVAVNDIVVEIETSKSLVELPIPYAGTVRALLAQEGDTVDVGAPIVAIADENEADPTPAPAPEGETPVAKTDLRPPVPGERVETEAAAEVGGEPESATDEGRVANLVGYGPRTAAVRRRPRRTDPTPGPAATPPATPPELVVATPPELVEGPRRGRLSDPPPATPPELVEGPRRGRLSDPPPATPPELVEGPRRGRLSPEPSPTPPTAAVLAKPPVRKLARDRGIELASLTGSGPDGVITRDDVERASAPEAVKTATEAAPVPAAQRDQGRETRTPLKGVRKATAEAMVRSAFTAPHVTEWVTCDVSATVELVQRLRQRREFADVRLSPLLVIAKAVCVALAQVPQLNAYFDDAAQEIVTLHDVNLGIAAATPRGLVVPNIKGAQGLGLRGLAEAVNAMISTARAGRIQPAELAGGTFTITNVGTFGVDAGTPILNPGESGILCVGQIGRRPWVTGSGAEERIEARWVCTLAVSFDHRVVDGEQGSLFLSTVAQILTDPGLSLLY